MISQPSTKVTVNGKVEHGTTGLSELQQRLRVIEQTVQLLIVRTSLGDHWVDGLREAANLLEALPLPTAEFAAMSSHLNNAKNYCKQQEFGAAAFELRALRGQLQRL
jgi:hypothetical protein